MLNASVIIGVVALMMVTVTRCQGATIPLLSQRNGEPTDANEYLEFTSVRRSNGDHLCGGVLIDADSLLTVASCLFDPSGRPFNIDELRVSIDSSLQRNINRIFIHPDFEAGQEINNIALLHLIPLTSTPATSLHPINTNIEPVGRDQKCTLVGWTVTDNDSAPTKRKMDVVLESENVTTSFKIDPAECQSATASALICNNMINGFLSTMCSGGDAKLTYTDVTQYNIWIDQIWRCELKPEIGGCQTTTMSTMRSTVEMIGSTVVYNERMDHTHEVITTDSSTMAPTTSEAAPEPAPEPVNNDQAEVGHVYHHDPLNSDHEQIHDFEQNQRTHENYHSPPEQDRVEAPKASSAVNNQFYTFLAIIPTIVLLAKLSF